MSKTEKNMKNLYAIIGMAGVLLTPSLYASLLYPVILTEVGGNDNGGGLFKAATPNGNFDTFCLSIVTTFYPGSSYYAQGSTTIAADVPPIVPTYVTYGTAYMYSQFLLGNATYAGDLNGNTADAVQATIWYLQGLLGGTGGMVDPENGHDLSGYIDSILPGLKTATGKDLSGLVANGTGLFNVNVMNLYAYSDGTGISQPQLADPKYAPPVPEPTTIISGALLLLPFGASTLRILRKNRAG
jgi:hypothetical protein